MRIIEIEPDFTVWRDEARKLLAADVTPEEVQWVLPRDQEEGLLVFPEVALLKEQAEDYQSQPRPSVPKLFFQLGQSVACHRSDQQWSLLYDVLWRITRGVDRFLLMDSTDDAIFKLQKMQKEIRRDIHKMRAFVRFKQVNDGDDEHYVAWFEPDHRILRLNMPFFKKRFTGMKWSILTSDECAHWDGENIEYSAGLKKGEVPEGEDEFESYWLTYYRSTFNPARLKIKMMQSEMPKKYWKNLPEAEVIEELIQGSSDQVLEMMEKHASAVKPMPKMEYLKELQRLNGSPDDVSE